MVLWYVFFHREIDLFYRNSIDMAITYIEYSHADGFFGYVVIPRPVHLVIGNLMIAHVIFLDAVNTSFIASNGWVTIDDYALRYEGIHCATLWKIADASDVAASSFTFSGTWRGGISNKNQGGIYTFSGIDGSNPIGGHNVGSGDSSYKGSRTCTVGSITPLVADSMLIFCVFWDAGTNSINNDWAIGVSNPVWGEKYNVIANNITVGMACGIRHEVTATGNGTVTYNNAWANAGFLIVVNPL